MNKIKQVATAIEFRAGMEFTNSNPDKFPPITIMAVVDNWIMAKKNFGFPFYFTKEGFTETFIDACKYKLKAATPFFRPITDTELGIGECNCDEI